MNKTTANTIFLLSILTTIAGQIFLKKATTSQTLHFDASRLFSSLVALAMNPYVLAWVFSAGISATLWIFVLSRFELSFAFPVSMTLSYVLILVLSWWLFGEQMSLLRWLGISLMCAGIFMAAQS
jgi:multidrug transporter EmrE-like cation transporter